MDHNPARRPTTGAQQIGVRALLGAGGHAPRVALIIPGVPPVRLSAAEAEQLAAAIVQTLGQARACLTPPPVQASGERREARGDEEGPT